MGFLIMLYLLGMMIISLLVCLIVNLCFLYFFDSELNVQLWWLLMVVLSVFSASYFVLKSLRASIRQQGWKVNGFGIFSSAIGVFVWIFGELMIWLTDFELAEETVFNSRGIAAISFYILSSIIFLRLYKGIK